jgi:hypothetical protein
MALAACLVAGTADAMYVGAGPMIGEPVGISFKVWPHQSLAFDVGLGYSWWQDSSPQAQADLIFHSVELAANPTRDGAFSLYMGLGAQMRLAGQLKDQNLKAGLRMPLGFEYFFPGFAVSMYAEAVPIFNLGTTDQYFSGDGVFGFRYYWSGGF